MKRILVPCDFSKVSLQAYQFAVELATAAKAEIVVMHAIDLPAIVTGFDVPLYVYDPALKAELEEVARKNFKNMVSANKDATVLAGFDVRFDSVTRAVTQLIDEGRADLVVMGTNGASGWNELFIGTNTERVVRHSTVPVIAIRKAPGLSSIKKIIFPNALGLDQAMLVYKVIELQSFFGASLHVLWVNTPGHFVPDATIHGLMKDFAQHYGLSNYTLEVRSDNTEGAGIASCAREIGADMIAMGTHGRKGVSHLLAGSIAEEVVNHGDCPIWTYVAKTK